MPDLVVKSVRHLAAWIERNQYQAYEPFDGLSSFLHIFTFKNWLAERLLQQSVLRCPFHIRPLIGVTPKHSTKAMGYMARGFLRLWQSMDEGEWKNKAVFCLDWPEVI